MSEPIFGKKVGKYILSVIYRESSSPFAYGHKYHESAILYRDSNCAPRFALHPIDSDLSKQFESMNSEEDVESYLEKVKLEKENE